MNADLNLRPGGATRGKWSIIRWEGRGVVCGYSRLQGGSPRLCRLRTVRSGPLNEYLIMYCPHARFMGSGVIPDFASKSKYSSHVCPESIVLYIRTKSVHR
jgi:hypothetical protein